MKWNFGPFYETKASLKLKRVVIAWCQMLRILDLRSTHKIGEGSVDVVDVVVSDIDGLAVGRLGVYC